MTGSCRSVDLKASNSETVQRELSEFL